MKKRLDDILLELNFVENKSKARSLIMNQKVIVNNEKKDKPGSMFEIDKIKIQVLNSETNFVSRAGEKLYKAIKKWNLNIKDLICLDIGSSTGGFTDCCIQSGAKKIYAVDVGINQLDWKIRNNEKVISMEKTNFRNCKKNDFNDDIDFFCCDVSFISVKKILLPLKDILNEKSFGVILIKPQFESERDEVIKGRVTSKEVHLKSILSVINFCIDNNFSVLNLDYSPILGNKKKNVEFILLIEKNIKVVNNINEDKILEVINESKKLFNKQ